ncbi:MAG: RNA 2',3'-cyclic phosphodiesterase [Woeseia sp.]|nr:RNA 2',3'-cyclic phosphodiesterase [Woeseia sp.]NNE59671.1 RNA 2',3'-cyclic phosphodiesterase [Woeseia sp.]NNL54074.1 RNA 2',3'-cyclic phosphodiesterase [Woeseia sp.]
MAKRLFFGLWPSNRQREALRDPIKAAIGAVEGVPVLRGNWHITLVFLGPLPEQDIPALQAAAAEVTCDPFRLRLDRLEFWPRPKTACLLATGVPPALQSLHEALQGVAVKFGVQPEERFFRPHLTVVRRGRPFEPVPLAQPVLLEWSGFELLQSDSTPQGAQYSPLKQGSTDNS